MATSTCSQCNSSYPSMLKACPSCNTETDGPQARSASIKKLVPWIVAVDLLLIGAALIYFFVIR